MLATRITRCKTAVKTPFLVVLCGKGKEKGKGEGGEIEKDKRYKAGRVKWFFFSLFVFSLLVVS